MTVELSAKQKLYLDILDMILPYVRSVSMRNLWTRIRVGSFHAELELVHNLPQLLLKPEFCERDLHWLNAQARYYYKEGKQSFPFRKAIIENLEQLSALVPESQKDKLRLKIMK